MKMTERQFQNQVIHLARLNGWKITHFRPAINRSGKWSTPLQGDPGWPDLVLVRPPEALFVELKAEAGKVSALQQGWLDDLRACGLLALVWRPSDFEIIQSVLSRRPAA